MMRLWMTAGACALLGLIAACGMPGQQPQGVGALSDSTPITVGPQVAGLPAGPFLADGQQSGDLMVWLSSSPAPPVEGTSQLSMYVYTTNGTPVAGATVSYDIDMTNMSHGEYVVPADAADEGRYVGRVHLSMSGPWRVIATIERPDQPAIRLRFEFRVN